MSVSTIRTAPGCADSSDPGRMGVEQARVHILAHVTPVSGAERLGLWAALGRVLAADVLSPVDVPAHTNSAVDGYALAAEDLPHETARSFRIAGTAWAGRPYAGTLARGECVRIMTGAPMPAGADTAVMQEHTESDGDAVRIGAGHRKGQNVRAAGEDLARGQTALAAGTRIGAAELGLLASLGRAEVDVLRRARVAFFSTGDELRGIGEPLSEGQIYDSNRYTLYGMLTQLGVEVLDMGVVPDTRQALEQALSQASRVADVVLSSGGVSVGEADFVKEVMEALGEVSFWQVAMKPGRPLAFGRIGEAAFFGLPGNPVAVMVTFHQLARPALLKIMGCAGSCEPLTLKARSVSEFRKRPGRTEFPRGILERDGHEPTVRSTGAQGSGILRSMSLADCLLVLPPERATVEPGDWVEVMPL